MRALLTGITGQDGAYLAQFLIEKGYEVFGTHRPSPSPNLWRLDKLNITRLVTLIPMDLTDDDSIEQAIQISAPHEIYNLAAQSNVRTSFDMPVLTMNVNGVGPLRIMRKIRYTDTRFYQASTSEMYGNEKAPQNEQTPMHPVSPYGWAKFYAYMALQLERRVHGTFAASGILFNHESPLRGHNFVTQKICTAIRERNPLKLGNLEAKRDWGHARDYVKGMWMMMQHDKPDDFVLATGETRSVQQFLDKAIELCGHPVEIEIDPDLYREEEVNELRGDWRKAATELGWMPETPFENLVSEMLSTSSLSS